jgi:predicted Zn-dependent protease
LPGFWSKSITTTQTDIRPFQHMAIAAPDSSLPGSMKTRIYALLALIGCLFAAHADTQLPDIASPSDSLMSPTESRQLGRSFMRSVRRQLTIEDDPFLGDYISNLGNQLTAHASEARQPFEFFLIRDDNINAFAGPGGYIGVNTGLILHTQSESELASVVGHEIAHVTQNHLMRSLDRQARMTPAATALMVAALVLGAAVSPDAGLAAAAAAQAGVMQQQINYTRQNEQEADRIGIHTLAASGYDPRAMPSFFDRLTKATRLYANNAPEYLRTHPVTTNRIADAIDRAEEYPYRQYQSSTSYGQIKAILKLRSFAQPGQAVEFFASGLEEGRYLDQYSQRYGLLLALLEAKRYKQAAEQLAILKKQDATQTGLLLAEARLLRETGEQKRALKLLETSLMLFPTNYPLNMAYGRLALDQGMPEQALRGVSRLLDNQAENPLVYQLLAEAAGRAGQRLQSHRYLAEYHYWRGELELAIKQLEFPLNDGKLNSQREADYYETARMRARLEELQKEKERWEKEQPL